jgi:hypothetical protein
MVLRVPYCGHVLQHFRKPSVAKQLTGARGCAPRVVAGTAAAPSGSKMGRKADQLLRSSVARILK